MLYFVSLCIFIPLHDWESPNQQKKAEFHLFSAESTFTAVISAGKLGLVNPLNKGQGKGCLIVLLLIYLFIYFYNLVATRCFFLFFFCK